MVSILRFANESEYQDWLKSQSWDVKDKAKEFSERYPGVIPVVIEGYLDTAQACDYGEVHLFVPPQYADWVDKIIG